MMNNLEKYNAARYLIANGDVINWQVDSLLGKIIMMVDTDSHTSLVTRLDEFGGMKDRIFCVESRARTEMNLLSKRLADTRGAAYLLRLKRHWDPIRPYIAGWVCEQIGNPYDVKGLLGNIFGRVSMDAKHFFCSELAWFALREGAIRYSSGNGTGHTLKLPRPVAEDVVQTIAILKGRAPRPGDFRRMPMYEEPIRIL